MTRVYARGLCEESQLWSICDHFYCYLSVSRVNKIDYYVVIQMKGQLSQVTSRAITLEKKIQPPRRESPIRTTRTFKSRNHRTQCPVTNSPEARNNARFQLQLHRVRSRLSEQLQQYVTLQSLLQWRSQEWVPYLTVHFVWIRSMIREHWPHTLCYRCLQDHITHTGQDGQFQCPECRRSLHIPSNEADDFAKNFFINSCIDALEKAETGARSKAGPRTESSLRQLGGGRWLWRASKILLGVLCILLQHLLQSTSKI